LTDPPPAGSRIMDSVDVGELLGVDQLGAEGALD
jgi:hypothetical protein